MIDALINPIVFFFILGLVAGLLRSDLKIPDGLYETLSIYLLLAIGLKGGVELSKVNLFDIIQPMVCTLAVGILIPLIAYTLAKTLFNYSRINAAALATHYGSVSAVTFAVCLTYLTHLAIPYDPYVTVMLVILEVPALIIGIMLAKTGTPGFKQNILKVLHEVLFGQSIFLLVGGLLIGLFVGAKKMEMLDTVFVAPFKGVLAFFLLEMGLMVSKRISSLKTIGPSLVIYGICMPILSGTLASILGAILGLHLGTLVVLATLSASASYIAAPAAVRVAIPKANPAIYLTSSLAITFPFNVVLGIPIYHQVATFCLTLFQGSAG